LQCSQRVASDEAAAPQLGQFNDCAAMRGRFSTPRQISQAQTAAAPLHKFPEIILPTFARPDNDTPT
jgi:hypothetical protein